MLNRKCKLTRRDRSHLIDLEERALAARHDFTRRVSGNTDISPPPSYRSRRDTLVIPAPIDNKLPEPSYEAKEQDIAGSSSWSKSLRKRPNLSITVPETPKTDIELLHEHGGQSARMASIDVARHHLEPTRDSLDLTIPDRESNLSGEEKIGVAR